MCLIKLLFPFTISTTLHVLDKIIFFFHNFDKQGKTSSNYNARVSSNFFERLIMRTKHTKK